MSNELIEKLRENADSLTTTVGIMNLMHEAADTLDAKAAPVGEREAFEAWHTDTYGAQSEFNPVRSLEWGDLGYVDCTVQAQFHAFCGAARAAYQCQQALEVVAYRYKVAYEFGGEVMCWEPNGRKVLETFPLADHADAERAIAELREECERVKSENDRLARHINKMITERDILRQQLAERDAQIASMRAEVTPFIETHWMPVARQRDKLADLLDEVKSDLSAAMNWGDLDRIAARIDAALAEVASKK